MLTPCVPYSTITKMKQQHNTMKYCIGIDIGGTTIKGAIVSENGRPSSIMVVNCKNDGNYILSALKDLIATLKSQHPGPIAGIGVGTPGVVDPVIGGVADGCPNIPDWKGIPFIPELSNTFLLPVYAHNDVSVMSLAELYFGAAKGKKHVICVALGTGIGGGIIINGDLYDGTAHYAGEIGHMSVARKGRRCNCGSYGCWEAYASAVGMRKTAEIMLKKHVTSILEPTHLTPKHIFACAEKGDLCAQAIVSHFITYLGIGTANLINIFNPEMLIIGGGIAKAGNALLEPLHRSIAAYGMGLAVKTVQIKPATFHEHTGIIGSAAYAMQRLGIL